MCDLYELLKDDTTSRDTATKKVKNMERIIIKWVVIPQKGKNCQLVHGRWQNTANLLSRKE